MTVMRLEGFNDDVVGQIVVGASDDDNDKVSFGWRQCWFGFTTRLTLVGDLDNDDDEIGGGATCKK
jgi:hypothetical protein